MENKYRLYHPATRQCCYCDNYFASSKNEFSKHIKKCTSVEGITYNFENNKIISFQDNFKYLGDIPFTVYFDFETTTGDNIFQDPKMFVISYCQIIAFHPALNLEKMIIFRSFQQSAEEIYDLSHFRQEHIPFFDKVTFYQFKDAATAVLAREKSTSLSELFSVELKFTVDTLTNWFQQTIKLKFLELDNIKKQIFVKENPTVPSKTTCCVCGFLLDIEGGCGSEDDKKTWYNFAVEKDHLFIRNVFSKQELADMENISNIKDYHKEFGPFVKIVMLLEKYLNNPRVGKTAF